MKVLHEVLGKMVIKKETTAQLQFISIMDSCMIYTPHQIPECYETNLTYSTCKLV